MPYYHRQYETLLDQTYNAKHGAGRARSGSIGYVDHHGNTSNRIHYHATEGNATMMSPRPNANMNQHGDVSYHNTRPNPPGAVDFPATNYGGRRLNTHTKFF